MSEHLSAEERLRIGERICWECAPRNIWAEVERILSDRLAAAAVVPLVAIRALADRWEAEAADQDGHSLLTQAYRNLARELRDTLGAAQGGSAEAVWTCPDCEGEFPVSRVARRDV